MEGLETNPFSFEVPSHAMEDLVTNSSVPEVSTYDVEAILMAEFLTKPTFLDSEPTRAGRKRKAKDMSGLTLCFCGERSKPGNVGSIQCQKAGCATVWVGYSILTHLASLWLILLILVSSSMCWV